MSHYKKDDGNLAEMASSILNEFETHKPVLDAGVKIDFLWAYGDRDDDGELCGDAIKKGGVRALGMCKVIGVSERAKGNGDVEIRIDADYWGTIEESEQRAILDHELHHIKPIGHTDEEGRFHPKKDYLERPKIKMRPHTHEVGWFGIIAERHGAASVEVKQARQMMDSHGQLYWPDVAHGAGVGKGIDAAIVRFSRVVDEMAAKGVTMEIVTPRIASKIGEK